MSPTHYRLVVKGELGARYASARQAMTERPESSQPDRRCASVGVGRETHISLAGVGKSPPGAQSKEA